MTRIASVSGVRGVIGSGFDPVLAAEFAAAYATECGPGPIVVGHDGRVSAPVIVPAVLAAVRAVGHDALDAGAVATPTLGVLVRDLGAAGGIQVSASHNPPEYNGLKFFRPGGMVLDPAAGRVVLERFERREFGWVGVGALGRGTTIHDPDGGHLRRVLGIVDVDRIRACDFLVALDACHGAGGRAGTALLESLGCRSIVLGSRPDGLYDHPPEPTEENLKEFAAIVRDRGAAVGFAQDPDADRLAIVDETGRYIGEELTLTLAVLHCLPRAPGPLVLNLSTSRVSEALAERFGCPVHRTPVGEVHVVDRMRAVDASLGGEGNGGVIDPRIGWVRDSLAAMAITLDLLAERRMPLSAIVDELPRYAMVKRKFPFSGGPSAIRSQLETVASAYPEARAEWADGLRLDWPDGWAHARASNTEPIVRVIAEAADPRLADELADRVGSILLAQGEGRS